MQRSPTPTEGRLNTGIASMKTLALSLLFGGALTISAQAADQHSADTETHGSAVGLIGRKIEVHALADNISYASGVGNVIMISTSEGNVIFDTGLGVQASQQYAALLNGISKDSTKYVILSHSHADHIGGAALWSKDGAKIVAHREFEEEERYLAELAPYFHGRNRTLFPWMPDRETYIASLTQDRIAPDIVVDEGRDLQFRLGDVQFEVIAAPGAEGADNIVLWLPEQKILFSGDFFGPQFPQFPNIFTMRGEKIRKPIEYIESLDRIIALRPDVIMPSHFGPTRGANTIHEALVRTRDAVRYVHDATVAGMNAGKSVEQLMEEIRLPAELSLPQNHGRVSWAVRSIWEYYATWFHFEDTTELYAVPAKQVYPELARMAGMSNLLTQARAYLDDSQPLQALHILRVALSADPSNRNALQLQIDALNMLLEAAKAGLHNDYEIYWLNAQIRASTTALKANPAN